MKRRVAKTGYTLRVRCWKCGAERVLASGANAAAMTPARVVEAINRAGWSAAMIDGAVGRAACDRHKNTQTPQ